MFILSAVLLWTDAVPSLQFEALRPSRPPTTRVEWLHLRRGSEGVDAELRLSTGQVWLDWTESRPIVIRTDAGQFEATGAGVAVEVTQRHTRVRNVNGKATWRGSLTVPRTPVPVQRQLVVPLGSEEFTRTIFAHEFTHGWQDERWFLGSPYSAGSQQRPAGLLLLDRVQVPPAHREAEDSSSLSRPPTHFADSPDGKEYADGLAKMLDIEKKYGEYGASTIC